MILTDILKKAGEAGEIGEISSRCITPAVTECVKSSSYFAIEGKLSLASMALFSIYGGSLSKIDCEDSFFLAGAFHFVHSLPLLFVHHTTRPRITKTLFISGILLYSGSCYLKAYSHKINHKSIESIGIWCAIFGWLSMLT